MSEYDFSRLFSQYETIIAAMPDPFTSHQFILALAKQEQVAYIEALHAYRDRLRADKPAPFMMVHGILAKQLDHYPHLVYKIKNEISSVNIWGEADTCALWKKV